MGIFLLYCLVLAGGEGVSYHVAQASLNLMMVLSLLPSTGIVGTCHMPVLVAVHLIWPFFKNEYFAVCVEAFSSLNSTL